MQSFAAKGLETILICCDLQSAYAQYHSGHENSCCLLMEDMATSQLTPGTSWLRHESGGIQGEFWSSETNKKTWQSNSALVLSQWISESSSMIWCVAITCMRASSSKAFDPYNILKPSALINSSWAVFKQSKSSLDTAWWGFSEWASSYSPKNIAQSEA